MIAYFDTSALVPIAIGESTRTVCQDLWDRADTIYGTRLLYVESCAALERAARMGRVDEFQYRRGLQLVDEYWREIEVIELGEDLMRLAGTAARAENLRGYDAVHCAAGLLIAADPDAVAVSGDAALLDAWAGNDAEVIDVNL